MTSDQPAEAPRDPRELMKAALEAKKNSRQNHAPGTAAQGKASGGPHGQQGGKRNFRRKSGG